MSTSYRVTTEQDTIVIRLPRAETDEAALAKLLDYLDLEAIRRHSALSKADVAELTSDVKQSAWQSVKHLFGDK